MLAFQAFRFELDPNNQTRSSLASHAGAARVAHNVMLAYLHYCLDRRAWERRTLGAAVTEVPWSLPALRREWNQIKVWAAPWWAANSKEAYNSGLDGLARGLDGWSKSRRGQRRGRPVRFPKMRRKSDRRSFRVTTGSFGVVDDRHVRLPRIGPVRTKEPTTALRRLVEAGQARVLSATISERAGRWYVSFCCQVERPDRPAPAGPPVGVDVGVKHLAALSTGEQVPNPKHVSKWQRRQARLQRQAARRRGPNRRNGQRPSKRWQTTQRRLARSHRRVADARVDGLHKLTRRLAETHPVIVVEDLNVAGMTAAGAGRRRRAKAGLNRAVLDAGFGELRRQLDYKCRWYGSQLVIADRWYPSSKTCSRCKTVKTKLPLHQRMFRCQRCGLVIDRDRNAAANLASLVEAATYSGTASGAGTGQSNPLVNGQGEEKFMPQGRCSSTNCQDSTSPTRPGQTATAAE